MNTVFFKFGVDFVLYRSSPANVHAQFAIRIQNGGGKKVSTGDIRKKLNLTNFQGVFPPMSESWCLLQRVDRVIGIQLST